MNKEERIALFEASIKDILKEFESENEQIQGISKALWIEDIGGEPIQVQITIQKNQEEWIEDLTSIFTYSVPRYTRTL